eukprot:COSAG01_NODE_4002_length_5442_cov_23.955830_5_plen_54_part_00
MEERGREGEREEEREGEGGERGGCEQRTVMPGFCARSDGDIALQPDRHTGAQT